mmetsp:Transcript_30019/g.37149  ORF Transcript_30019/g.37149 Transcript_30019/m.37149 type:complete len:109 (+) Transcript_30019:2030-2356(+)
MQEISHRGSNANAADRVRTHEDIENEINIMSMDDSSGIQTPSDSQGNMVNQLLGGICSNALSMSQTSNAGESSNQASVAMAKSDFFNKRDEGLACFNILDHLRQGPSL